MIQRIQSIYLLVAVLAGIATFFFKLATFLADQIYLEWYIYSLRNLTKGSDVIIHDYYSVFVTILMAAVMILAVLIIFLYKNRRQQLKLGRIAILINIVLIIVVFFIYPEVIERKLQVETTFETGIYFPLISLLFLIMASRAIMKDDKLVRSADRLR